MTALPDLAPRRTASRLSSSRVRRMEVSVPRLPPLTTLGLAALAPLPEIASADPSLRALGEIVRRDGAMEPARAVRIVASAARAFSSVSRRDRSAALVFSLGAALFFALTGKAPFEVSDAAEGPPAPSAHAPNPISPSLDAVVRTCLARQPDIRFSSPQELCAALSAVAFHDRAE